MGTYEIVRKLVQNELYLEVLVDLTFFEGLSRRERLEIFDKFEKY